MTFDKLHRRVVEAIERTKGERACLVGLSGIDASGKGFIAERLAGRVAASGHQVALINVDGWLNLPHIRFAGEDPGEHFYHHALRFEEMFDRLILPLKRDRSIDIEMDYAEETATEFRSHGYTFENVDIILLEGIFIFKCEFLDNFDLRIWIDCRFDTALERAVLRSQENLPPDETISAYKTIYFPAQRIHLELDDPVAAADIVYPND